MDHRSPKMSRSRFAASFRNRQDRSGSTTAVRGTTNFTSSRLDAFVRTLGPATQPQNSSLRFQPVHLTEARLDAFHSKAHNALSQTIGEFVKLGDKPIDSNRWRFLRSRGGASVYYDRRPLNQRLSSLLVAGTVKARLVDIMEGLYMDNTEDTRLVQHQLNSRFVDAEVLKVIEQRSVDHPYTFTGLKWSLIKTSGGGMISNRDVCFLEKLGMVSIAGGRKLGYFIMQSVDLPECPANSSRKVIRAHVSLCYLFEELREGVVGMYMTGNMESSGPQMLWKMARNNFADIALSIGGAVSVASAKRYARLMRSKYQPGVTKRQRSLVCEVCQSLPSFFDHHQECAGCNKMSVCKKCRIRRDVFSRESDSSPRLVSALFCIDCVESIRSPTKSSRLASPPRAQRRESREPTSEDEDEDLPRRTAHKFDSQTSSFYTVTEDESSDDNMPDSERSLRRFSLKLLQQLEDAGYSDSDACLRLSDLQSLGAGEMRKLCAGPDDDGDTDSEWDNEDKAPETLAKNDFKLHVDPYANVSVASSVFSVGDEEVNDDIDIDDIDDDEDEDEQVALPAAVVEKLNAKEEEEEEEEIVSIRPLRRSTQPPEMLEAQKLNHDGSLRSRPYANSCPSEPPTQQYDEKSMMRRLVQVSIAAEQTFRYTREQFERANKLFPTNRGVSSNQ